MDGILNINKPLGLTSADVVAKVKYILKQKVGHTGTLDPNASGVLPIVIGKATKIADVITDANKEYVATVRLGITTTTQDATGEVLNTQTSSATLAQVEQAIAQFVGDILQMPPMYSALKKDGKRLYTLAREGIEIEREKRKIHIEEIEILSQDLPNSFDIRVVCSKGTYIRTLCHDIGDVLGCGGHMQSLERTRVGRFKISNSITLAELQALNREQIDEIILPIDEALDGFPRLDALPSAKKFIDNGNKIVYEHIKDTPKSKKQEEVVLYDSEGTLIGIYSQEKEYLKPLKMLIQTSH